MAAGSGPWFEETLKKSEHPVQDWKLWRKFVSANDETIIMTLWIIPYDMYSDQRLFLASKFLPYFLKVTVLYWNLMLLRLCKVSLPSLVPWQVVTLLQALSAAHLANSQTPPFCKTHGESGTACNITAKTVFVFYWPFREFTDILFFLGSGKTYRSWSHKWLRRMLQFMGLCLSHKRKLIWPNLNGTSLTTWSVRKTCLWWSI